MRKRKYFSLALSVIPILMTGCMQEKISRVSPSKPKDHRLNDQENIQYPTTKTLLTSSVSPHKTQELTQDFNQIKRDNGEDSLMALDQEDLWLEERDKYNTVPTIPLAQTEPIVESQWQNDPYEPYIQPEFYNDFYARREPSVEMIPIPVTFPKNNQEAPLMEEEDDEPMIMENTVADEEIMERETIASNEESEEPIEAMEDDDDPFKSKNEKFLLPIKPRKITTTEKISKEKELEEISKEEEVILTATNYLGTKYVWAANGPNAFDCSGFTKYVYREIGVTLPRYSGNQAKVGMKVAFDELQKGDLVFFDTEKKFKRRVNHVGIYIGDGKFIHASSANKKVVITSFDKKKFYKRRFLWGQRVVNSMGSYASLKK